MKKFLIAAILATITCLQLNVCTTHAFGQLWAYKYASYCDYCNKLGNRTLTQVTAGIRDFRGTHALFRARQRNVNKTSHPHRRPIC